MGFPEHEHSFTFQESTFGTDQFGASFTDKVIRAKFVRKVYAILLSQLAVTVAVVAVIIFTPAVKTFYCARGRIHKVRGVEDKGDHLHYSICPFSFSFRARMVSFIALRSPPTG